VFGETTPHLPLYLAEAAVVELVALRVAPNRRPLPFGLWCGVGIGTVGLAAEWGWSHVWMPLPWPAEILPEAIVLGLAMALAASLLGAWIGAKLASDEIRSSPALRPAAATAALAIFALLAVPLFTETKTDVRAQVELREARSGPQRTVDATIALRPRDAADDATWLTVTAWQGDGRLVLDRLRRVAQGVYRTTQPIPVHGTWKAMVRLHTGGSLVALPIYAPRDTAIPAREIPAPRRFERRFRSDRELLQREARTRDEAITYAAYGTVLVAALALLALLAWGLHRVGATAGRTRDTPPPSWWQAPARPAPQPAPVASDVWPARLATGADAPGGSPPRR
jgi:hypothetical protein